VRAPTAPILRRVATGAWALLAVATCADAGGERSRVRAEDAVAAGDVDATSVVLWVRAKARGTARIEVAAHERPGAVVAAREVVVPAIDRPGKVEVGGLAPGTRHLVRATLPDGATARARFRTAAAPGVRRGLRFGASGDWSGDLTPYRAARNAAERDLDFFVALGDSVYADIASPAVPLSQAVTLAQFRAKHAEVYSERHGLNTLADLRASTAWFATIDDHEVGNDFAGGRADPLGPLARGDLVNDTDLFEASLAAFHEWNPIRTSVWRGTGEPAVDGEFDLYRHRVFGSDAALFVLDTRSFRSAPLGRAGRDAASVARWRAAAFAPGRTVLGAPQRERFLADLRAAHAAGIAWKFVVVPTPVQNLGPSGDRFEGYASERSAILGFVHDEGIRNVVFLTGDIHGFAVNDLEYQPSSSTDAHRKVDAFEVATLPIGCHGVLGRYTVRSGGLSDAERRAYDAADMDGKDDAATRVIDARLAREGLGPLGLADSRLSARLVEGKWLRGHAYGWCELEVDAATHVLTVTAWGIPDHARDDARRAAASRPAVLARFTVAPQAAPP
jgi:3-phytase/alkaline phosphatase D